MLATMTPQEAIKKGLPTPAQCDMSSSSSVTDRHAAAADWKKPDAVAICPATEWEYLNALEAADSQGKPAVLVYRRTATIALDPTDPDVDKKLQQWRLVQQFFQSFENPDGLCEAGITLTCSGCI